MSNFSLGKAEGEIALRYTGHPAAAAAEKDINAVGKSARTNSDHLDTIGRKSTLAGVAIAAGLGLAVKAAVSFEARLSGIAAVSGATGEQMEEVRKLALKLGKDTKFSADEAAVAIEELAKAGISLPDIMNGAAEATVALAAAGEIALPRAAEIAANAMNTFSLKAQDLPKVADLIAGAANASAIDVEQFAQSLQQSGAAAALAGIDFADLTTAIALMGNAGIKGSDAGTSLKTMLLNLQPETKKQIALMKDLGIITEDGANKFFDAQGKAKSLSEIAGVLQEALKGQTQQQKLATLATLFGSDAIRAAAILATQGSKGFDKMAASIGKVKAADVAAKRLDNFRGSLEQFKGSLETAAIALGTVLLPVLRDLLDGITGLVNAFLSLSPEMQSAIVYGASAAASFLLVFGAITKIIQVLAALRGALVLAFASNPVGIILAVIVALAAAMFILYQRFQPVRDVADKVGRALRDAFQRSLPYLRQAGEYAVKTGQALKDAFIAALPTLRAIADVFLHQIIPAVVKYYTFLIQTFGPLFVRIAGIVREFVGNIITYFKSIQPQLSTIFAFLSNLFGVVFPKYLAIVKFVFGAIFSFVSSTMKALAFALNLILSGMANQFRAFFNIIGGIFKVLVSLLTGQWGQAWEGVKQILRGALQFIIAAIQSAIGVAIILIVGTALKAIGALFRAGWSLVTGVVRGAMGGIRSLVASGMNAARAAVSSGMGGVRAASSSGWAFVRSQTAQAVSAVLRSVQQLGRLGSLIGSFFARAVSAVRQQTGALVSVVARLPGMVVGALGDLGGLLYAKGKQVIQGFIDGIKSMAGAVKGAVGSVLKGIGSHLPGSPVKEGPLTVLNRGYAGKQVMQMLIDGIQAREDQLVRTLSKITAPVPNVILGPTAGLVESASRTATVGTMSNVTATFPAGLEDAIGDAVGKAFEGAEIVVGGDGLARLVVKQLGPHLVKGVRR